MQTFQHFHIELVVKPRETCGTNGYNKLRKETSSPSPLKRVSRPPRDGGGGVQIHVLKIHLLQIHLLQIHLLQIHLLQIQSMFYKSNPIQSTPCFTICLYKEKQFFLLRLVRESNARLDLQSNVLSTRLQRHALIFNCKN